MKHVRYILFTILASVAVSPSIINAEVQQVRIVWTNLSCKEVCAKLLTKELQKVPGVDEITINQDVGQAVLTWKPKIPFEYPPINTATRLVGVAVRYLWLTVQGTIEISGKSAFLVSAGDNTRFELLNPALPSQKSQSQEYNYATRQLTPELFKQLSDAAAKKKVATIEGPLFMPQRMTVPAQLVVNNFTFSEQPSIKK